MRYEYSDCVSDCIRYCIGYTNTCNLIISTVYLTVSDTVSDCNYPPPPPHTHTEAQKRKRHLLSLDRPASPRRWSSPRKTSSLAYNRAAQRSGSPTPGNILCLPPSIGVSGSPARREPRAPERGSSQALPSSKRAAPCSGSSPRNTDETGSYPPPSYFRNGAAPPRIRRAAGAPPQVKEQPACTIEQRFTCSGISPRNRLPPINTL